MRMKPSILLAVLLCAGCFDTAKAETASDLPPAYKLQTDGSQWRWILIRGLQNGDDFVTWATYESREACANAAWNHYKFVNQAERVWRDEEPTWKAEAASFVSSNYILPQIIAYNATTQYDRYERVTGNILTTSETYHTWYETVGTNEIAHQTNVWAIGYTTESTTFPSAVIHKMTYGFWPTTELYSICTVQTLAYTGDWRNVEWRTWNDRYVWSEFPSNVNVEAK